MAATNSTTTYGTVTKTFHWLTALLIITAIILGAVANRLPYETNDQLAFKAQLFSFHKTLGVLVFAVALARILWALGQPKPGSLHPERTLETKLAEMVHWLLYISLVAVPLTGWIHHAASAGFAPILLPIGQGLPLVPKDEGVSELFAGLHWVWSKIMVGAILLHIAGALKHQIVDKDATMRRMWFGNTEAPDVPANPKSLTAPITAVTIYALATGGGAMAGLYTHHETVDAAVALEEVSSDWRVTDGSLEITVTQFGSQVTGDFNEWTSAITFDPEAEGVLGDVTTTIAIGSLELGSVTGQAMGADFFNVEAFPTATFTAEITRGDTDYVADGTLTIKDSTVPVTLPFKLTLEGGTAVMAGIVALDRRDFAIGNGVTDESNLGFGVGISINLTATRAAE
ncbi:cytochrome b/b6 domain-containing protein [Cognatiyoonia sp. IB215182]|uniref:cytochrome b/b6 domain-containing protein n=1 Tax=Cognatiyoonia sp. IB215182 TaxID=3097353 RepID=UPI002A168880|nr:cytochrome b/b6 domain-containing protein [Cognatiyoonia sp. IB215182]MDX8352232.1 cytochrome b/b6 domain-containing protein [Cognatiyoonia sp. IB215182]